MKFKSLTLFGTLLVSALSFAGQQDDDALKKLMRALESQRDVKATLIQVRSMGNKNITVKTQTVPGRGIRASTLKPTVYSGMVSFDNGVTYKLYDPHLNTVFIERSPNRYAFDLDFRKSMIVKNYAVSFEEDAVVARRHARVVLLESLKRDIADRRVYIDNDTDLILRYVVLRKGEPEDVRINTIKVDLWVNPGSDFNKVAPQGAIEVRPKAPREVDSASEAEESVKFKPVIPANLPAGLEKQVMHIVYHKNSEFVAVRLSDGMAFVTVYLYQSKHKDEEGNLHTVKKSELPMEGNSLGEATDGLRCWIIGDADEGLKSRIAKLFIQVYNRTID